MTDINPIWLEGQRQRWLRHDWQRFIRHDAHRFMAPDPNSYRSYASRLAEQHRAEEKQAAHDAEVRQLYGDHLTLRREVAELKFELAWRKLCRKHGYNPGQPRDELGRWTDTGGGANTGASNGGPSGPVLSDATPDPVRAGDQFAKVIPICMLGSHGTSMDQWRNRSWYAEYVCADGFTFRKSGPGDRIRPFWRDPR